MKDDRRGHRHSQVGLHGPAGPGAGHQEERAPVAAGRLQDLVAGAQRGQQDGLRAVQLRGEEEQPEEGLPREEPQGHARDPVQKYPAGHFLEVLEFGALRLGRTRRKTSARDASPTPSMDAEFPANGGGADRIYDLSIPAVVKFAYAAEREDELSLVKGSRVTVMEKCSDGWWRGSYNGQVGWFPSNYVLEELDEAAADAPGGPSLRPSAALSNGQGARVLHVVQTLYPFSSVTEEELNFDKGETMEVIEKPENDPEWWRCRNARGQVGLVPKNYVVVLSEGPAPHAGSGPAGPARAGRFAGREWYYGNVTRHQAECALNARGVQGDFLVRDSESSPSDFSVSLKASGKNKHFKVQLVDNVYCIGQRRFHTMDELVEHYKKAPIFTSEHGEKLYLVRALQ
nr:cytoplasmic protein NCK2 isoform X1 [Kogia breviceps]XP_058935519.1 cytoplasmic protein NCK2 isoform X1 [Kogia breviceps]XP_058935520.1 cytoplasmic protein NCK2 isoform X1 [Kogia breviceps]XP_058935521.1 cytoplasmic protein NCK2 isoform X1 [Kogia breviceps]XP_058935522.1 cytoplasmic protein NCK2 isoform X1 [Kogia breviceps]XP_058935523.1 cytoplasmic protein NCK2 isoform X1 [Kogia breviceps]XP_058935524.1 cytoplasmic protein NCK2 isoform X1 [Kogia breviceps]XP_058935525.1 cytoplasmic prote